jgi:hypothetical protein
MNLTFSPPNFFRFATYSLVDCRDAFDLSFLSSRLQASGLSIWSKPPSEIHWHICVCSHVLFPWDFFIVAIYSTISGLVAVKFSAYLKLLCHGSLVNSTMNPNVRRLSSIYSGISNYCVPYLRGNVRLSSEHSNRPILLPRRISLPCRPMLPDSWSWKVVPSSNAQVSPSCCFPFTRSLLFKN